MQTIFSISVAIALGALIAIYMPMNSQIAKHLGSAISANTLFYGIGLITTIALLFFSGQTDTIKQTYNLPPYLLIAGVLSALMVLGMTYLLPVLGARQLFICVIAGQILMALMVSHFQLFGSAQDPMTAKKLIGALFVMAGVAISVSEQS